jgi:hypothetical protein
MTEKQRLNTLRRAVRHLKNTTQGYASFEESGRGSEWAAAMRDLAALEKDLQPHPRAPNLGPVVVGGKSVLEQDLTHATGGLPGYPAFDDGWVAGRSVIAPEDLVVTKQSSAQGGDAFYATGVSGIKYWVGHVDRAPITGKKFRKGDHMASISGDHPRPHVHLGIDARGLIGRELLHRKDYTHGAPKVGPQLERGLGDGG